VVAAAVVVAAVVVAVAVAVAALPGVLAAFAKANHLRTPLTHEVSGRARHCRPGQSMCSSNPRFFAVRSRRRGSTFMTSEWISDLGKKSLGKNELGKNELGKKSNYPG
jgi:cbb3-type cytochrome oxidase cytochrome c subunit